MPVPDSLPTQSHPGAAIVRTKYASVSFWFLTISVLFYLSVLLLGTLRGYVHLQIVLLLLQYLLLLPAVLRYLRRQQDAVQAVGSVPRVNVRVIAVCFALLALPLSWLSVRGLLNPDESGYSFQARIYRSGRIMADPLIGAPSDVRKTPAELFYANHVLRPNGWFPKFPPGWPLVLSLGYLLSARWVITPVFGLVQLLVIAACGSRCFFEGNRLDRSSFCRLIPVLSGQLDWHDVACFVRASRCQCMPGSVQGPSHGKPLVLRGNVRLPLGNSASASLHGIRLDPGADRGRFMVEPREPARISTHFCHRYVFWRRCTRGRSSLQPHLQRQMVRFSLRDGRWRQPSRRNFPSIPSRFGVAFGNTHG